MGADSTITIGLLLPDVLGTYSDAGNATVLAQRLRWRDIPAEIVTITARDNPPTSCEIYLVGGGEDRAQLFATSWLRDQKKLTAAISERALTLAVCAGMQILGQTMTDSAGQHVPGVGLVDLTTTPRERRAIGEVVSDCHIPGVGMLTGFENHRGGTTLATGTAPLGRVIDGIGNGADMPSDGVLTDHIIGTYLHGPVLARNPALADHILERVVGRELEPLELPDVAAMREHYLHRVSPSGRLRTRLLPSR